MSKRVSFVVSVEQPDDVSVPELREYIREAVGAWCKGTCPDDPIFDLDADKVRVRRQRKVVQK
jgi:hypothetical protein